MEQSPQEPVSGRPDNHAMVRAYYDEHADELLRGFILGNPRVEAAWFTISQWGPRSPASVMEVGCGIGDMCWRMSQRWSQASIMGIDISPRAIQIAKTLFGSDRVRFAERRANEIQLEGTFDLIAMVDVYEHIASPDRVGLHRAMKEMLATDGRMFLSFPTPRHLAWLRDNAPDQIQPVDQDIDPGVMAALADDTETEVLLYEEMTIWNPGDYAHAVLGRVPRWPMLGEGSRAQATPERDRGGRRSRLWRAAAARKGSLASRASRWRRARLVRQRLGRMDP